MPYYLYAVKPFAQLEKLAEFSVFRDASTHAKALRAQRPTGGDAARIKVVFAEDPLAAEDLLLQVRDAPPDGDD